jgi:hypothetical protein
LGLQRKGWLDWSDSTELAEVSPKSSPYLNLGNWVNQGKKPWKIVGSLLFQKLL